MQPLRSALKRWLPQGGLRRSFSILAGGTVLAQAIAFAVSPILTRLYRVEDFGYLQIFNSIVAVLLVVVAGRYEMAVPLPEDDETAANLLVFAVCLVLFNCLWIGGALWAGVHIRWVVDHVKALRNWLWLIPFCLAGAGLYQLFSYWALRKKQFALVARSRVIQVGARFSLQLIAALLRFGFPGLLVSETVARASGTSSFVKGSREDWRRLTKKVRWPAMLDAARSYKHFPLVFSASGLLNTATLAFPSLFLATAYGTTVTGWFALVDRVLGAPSILIGQALQQIYVGEGAALIHSDPMALKHLFLKLVRKIYLIPICTSVFLVFFGPTVFVFVFGEQWREAGEYARIMCFIQAVGLLVAPIEMTLAMLQLHNWRFAWDAGRLVLVTAAMLGIYALHGGPRAVITAYAAAMILGYAVFLLLSYFAVQRLGKRQTPPETGGGSAD